MMQLAEEVLTIVGGKSKIAFCPLPQDDPKQRQPDISLAKSLIDWRPNVQLNKGLRETVKYFRARLES